MRALHRPFHRILELPIVYRSLQVPFAKAKVRPFLRRVAPERLQSVLDVGCGPGTNASIFPWTGYVGVDINPKYIRAAERRMQGRFIVGDVTNPDVLPNDKFQCVFINSLMHHLPDDVVSGLLERIPDRLAPGGAVYILDLILPDRASPARMLARLDRGEYPRALDHWRRLFTEHLVEQHLEAYAVGVLGLPLWWMVYFEGEPR